MFTFYNICLCLLSSGNNKCCAKRGAENETKTMMKFLEMGDHG